MLGILDSTEFRRDRCDSGESTHSRQRDSSELRTKGSESVSISDFSKKRLIDRGCQVCGWLCMLALLRVQPTKGHG